MVKVQKPSPKTLKKDASNKTKGTQIKKSKIKQTKPIPTSSVISKKEKTKLVKETIKPLAEKNVTKDKTSKAAKQQLPKNVEVESGKKTTNKKANVVVNKKSKQPKTKPTKPNKKPEAEATPKQSVPLDKAQKRKAAIKAFNKDKKKKRTEGVDKVKKPSTPLAQFEAVPFDEEKFKAIVNLKNIKKIGNALKKLVEEEVNKKKTSIFSDYRYFLNVSSYKIANCPKRMVKLNLKHSLVDVDNDDVVIIVPDLQRGAKVDYEPTIQHYEDLFRDSGVTNLKIVPFNQLRNECTTFETKRKFANTYDYFLCDGRIVSHVVGFCGKNFQKPRTTFYAVRLNNPKKYKSEIESALKRTSYKQLEKGDLISIPVGSHRFTNEQLAENVELVVEQLKNIFPGGYANIRNIHMKIDIKGTSSLPLYVNLGGAPPETPHVVGLREQRMLKLKKEANDILSKFSLSKTGEIVKLNKTQVQRKQKLREAREALTKESSKETNESNVNDEAVVPPAPKKARKESKQEVKKQVKAKAEEIEAESSEEDNDDDEEEELGDNVEDESDDEDNDDDQEENDDEDEDDGSEDEDDGSEDEENDD